MCEVVKGVTQKGPGEWGSSPSKESMGVQESFCLVIAIQTHSLTLDLGSLYQRDALVLMVENREGGHGCIMAAE